MSLKQELQVWANALEAFDKQEFDLALANFEQIADTSRIFFNIGLIHATLGGHEQAVAYFEQAIDLDPFLAVGFFQSGVSQFLLGRYTEAKKDFDDAYVYLRGNDNIDYKQLGLDFKLFSCEVLFNRGLSSINLGRREDGMADLVAAAREKRSQVHGVIDEACADRGEGYTVFSVPVGILFRPSDSKLKNLETRDYLGKAKVVAASDANDLFIGFSGTRKLAASAGNSRSASGGSSVAGGSAPPSLNRSKTSAARLESSGDGRATPLRPRPSINGSDGGLKRSVTANATFSSPSSSSLAVPARQLAPSPQARQQPAQLPTPPPSDGFPVPQPRLVGPPSALRLDRTPSVRKTYGLASSGDLLDDYYTNELGETTFSTPSPKAGSAQPRPAVPPQLIRPPTLPSDYNQSAELDRVANWAAQSALPSNPRGGGASSSPLSRGNSAGSSAGSQNAFSPSNSFTPSKPAPAPSGYRGPVRKQSLLQRNIASQEREEALEGVGAGMLNLDMDDGGGEEYEYGRLGVGMRNAGRLGAMGTIRRSPSQLSYAPSATSGREEMVKIRVKLRYKGDTRGMSIAHDLALDSFAERVRVKFESRSRLPMKYKDSESALVSIIDQDDWDSAMDQAREAADGRSEGKLEIILD